VTAEFWAGTLVGAAVGLLLQFAARPLNRYLDQRVEDRAHRQSDVIKQWITSDRAAARDWLVEKLIEMSLVGAITGVLGGLFFLAGAFMNASNAANHFHQQSLGFFGQILNGVGQAFILVGAYLVLRIATDAIGAARLIISLPKPQGS
jgi:hypothetical protein